MPTSCLYPCHASSLCCAVTEAASQRMPSSSSKRGHNPTRRTGRGRGLPFRGAGRSHPYQQRPRTGQPEGVQRRTSFSLSDAISRHQPTPARSAAVSLGRSSHPAGHRVREDDFLDQVIVAIHLKEKGTVGCAYYVAAEERLLCMEEVSGGGMDIIERCGKDCPTTKSHPQTHNGSENRPRTYDGYFVASIGRSFRLVRQTNSATSVSGGQRYV